MLGARPKLSERFLNRPRLLERLPEEPGHIVWLHAPYGYGKSILAAQWAQELEALGWRVLWFSVAGKEVRGLLAKALGLSAEVPWEAVAGALWNPPTLLVLEDLDESTAVSPVLQELEGLVLLASRQPLHDPSLLKLHTLGRVTELGARDLAFDLSEARLLIPDEAQCQEALAISQGWPLPLHFTALTGHAPERRALLEGIRASVSPEEWREVMLLASLPQLPDGAENEATLSLAAEGFVQHLENGFRLHPLAAETVRAAYPNDMRVVVKGEAERLPPLLQGEAFEAAGLCEELGKLLENPDVDLARYDAEAVLRWDERVPFPRGAVRTQRVGYALATLGRTDEGVRLILEGGAAEGSPDRKLDLYKDAVWWLASRSRFGEALEVAQAAEPYLDRADPEIAGRFLTNCAYIYFSQGDWERAERGYLRALDYFPEGADSQRYLAETNLGIVRWHRVGDLEGLMIERRKALQHNRRYGQQNVVGDLLQLGDLGLFLGERESARQNFREAQRFARAHPSFALIADGRRALIEGDMAAFPTLWDRSKGWGDPQIQDRVLVSWVTCLREHHLLDEGLRVSEGHRGPWTDPQRALILYDLGRTAEALVLLADPPSQSRLMEERLYWHAARFQITAEPQDLNTLLSMTLVGARVLPGLVPLKGLPRDRPELASAYPLNEVLASGWKGAIELRLDELPSLEVSLLGGFKVTRAGQHLDLSGRHQEMLTLMALGVSKEVMGEAIWPETAAKKVRNNLYVNLNALKKILEPWGVGTYLEDLTLIRTRTDLWALEAALEAGDHSAVFTLYKGPLVPHLDLTLVAEARENLHRCVLDLLLKVSLEEATWQAEPYLRRIVELDPLNETALQELLRRLIKKGRKLEALRYYRSFAHRLGDEMGLEPAQDTVEILYS
jgi:DNA-binding SARP family transcriptional activator